MMRIVLTLKRVYDVDRFVEYNLIAFNGLNQEILIKSLKTRTGIEKWAKVNGYVIGETIDTIRL